jgi:hypothetical protein
VNRFGCGVKRSNYPNLLALELLYLVLMVDVIAGA